MIDNKYFILKNKINIVMCDFLIQNKLKILHKSKFLVSKNYFKLQLRPR